MKREENNTEKEAYITPAIEKVAIDNEISVVLMSGFPSRDNSGDIRDDV